MLKNLYPSLVQNNVLERTCKLYLLYLLLTPDMLFFFVNDTKKVILHF